jgi:hypothetical protein
MRDRIGAGSSRIGSTDSSPKVMDPEKMLDHDDFFYSTSNEELTITRAFDSRETCCLDLHYHAATARLFSAWLAECLH